MMNRVYPGKASRKLVWIYVWTEYVEEQTQDKQYSNSNRRNWSQVNRKFLGFPFEMWIIQVNDVDCWEGNRSQLLGIWAHLSVELSNITIWHFFIQLTQCGLFQGKRCVAATVSSFAIWSFFARIILTLEHKSQTFPRTQIKCMRCT